MSGMSQTHPQYHLGGETCNPVSVPDVMSEETLVLEDYYACGEHRFSLGLLTLQEQGTWGVSRAISCKPQVFTQIRPHREADQAVNGQSLGSVRPFPRGSEGIAKDMRAVLVGTPWLPTSSPWWSSEAGRRACTHRGRHPGRSTRGRWRWWMGTKSSPWLHSSPAWHRGVESSQRAYERGTW